MKFQQTTLISMVLLILSHAAAALYFRKETFEASRISEKHVSANVWSTLPGDLSWVFTDDHVVTILVTVNATSELHLNTTRVTFRSDHSSFKLDVHERRPEAVAAVTGSASRPGLAVLMIWLPAVLVGWKHFSLMLLLLLLLFVASGMSERSDDEQETTDVTVLIEVHAPRSFQYKAINLFVLGGTVRVYQSQPTSSVTMETAASMSCRTDRTSEGCNGCCYGNGICTESKCICDQGFDPVHNCRLKNRQEHLFSHHLDPRLSRSFLPNGDILTLSRTPSTLDKYPVRFNRGDFYIDIRSTQTNVEHIQLSFSANGFLKKIHDTINDNKLILRMARTSKCVVNINEVEVKFSNRYSVDICKQPNMRAPRAFKSFWRNSNRRKMQRDRSDITGNDARRTRYPPMKLMQKADDNNVIDIPVKIERCGDNSTAMAAVYFELTPMYQNANRTLLDLTSGTNNQQTNESIILHPYTNSSSQVNFLRLPNSSVRVINSSISSKCDLVIETRMNVCKSRFLQTLYIVCNNVQYGQTHGNMYYINETKSSDLCTYVWDRLHAFCDIHSTNKLITSSDDHCSSFEERVDLFEADDFLVKPVAVFPDGKEVIGLHRRISIQNAATLANTAIVIKDERPEFKIVKISVIPRDPVPLDIYQVRMDYTCATNQTVIRMNVTGSDFYRNHVTCNGITSCNCCILHAAGAKDATVDRVMINITDPLTQINISKEMVVIF